MALATPGLGSGLDVNGLVTQLMTVERRPLNALDTKEAKYQAQLTAYGTLKGALSAFQSAVAALAVPEKFSTISANVADAGIATATASSKATPGSYAIEVQTLAQAQKLKSTAFPATATTLGTGTLTLQFGTYDSGTFTANPDKPAQTVTIEAGKSSLSGVRDAINAANVGVSASIVNDGTGYRLVIAAKDSGTANALRITVADDDLTPADNNGLSRLAFDASTGGTANLSQTVAAQNATLVIDGIAVSKSSNVIDDAIDGVTLNLLKANTPETTTLNVSRDTAGMQTAIQSFVKSYNDLNRTITNLSKYDAATKTASTLTGDATVRSIQAQLRGVFNTALTTAGGGLQTLADIGITFQKDGTLKLDTAKLNTVAADPAKNIASLFALAARPSDSLVSYVSSTSNTKDDNFLLQVTQLATRGGATGSAPAALTINAGVNDTLSLTVDGIPVSITLAAGTYNAASLAAELQSRINGQPVLPAGGAGVTVSQSAGTLNITSNRYGSASSVKITGGSASADLFGTATETTGVDVAGTLGGIPATGSGRQLTGAGDAAGLVLEINGGTTGFRGTVGHARGYAYTLDKLVGKLLDGDSLLDGRLDGINASIKDLDTRRASLTRRLEQTEKRYRAQFNALDTMVASMSKTSTFLQQQLANLPKAGS